MTAFYPYITLLSIVLFGALGWIVAHNRGHNRIIWAVMGAIFPPLLIILWFLKPNEEDAAADDGGELDEG